jgi:serine/threonine protein phosphatase PrpC
MAVGMDTPAGLFARFFRRRPKRRLSAHAAAASQTGRRANNQDAALVRDDLRVFAVADGMGGYEGGEIASRLTVEAIAGLYQEHRDEPDCTWPVMPDSDDSLSAQRGTLAIRTAHAAVRAERRNELAQMGSTIVLATLDDDRLVVAHAGDSRAYRLRAGRLEQLTRDHSFLEEIAAQRPLAPDERERLEAQLGHVVTRAIGHGERLEPTVLELPVEAGDRYLLCSDGVHGWLLPEELARGLALGAPEEAADQLVALALEAGSNDSVTAVVVEIRG